MLIVSDKRVAQRAAVGSFRVANYYASANGVAPAGSATMTWVTAYYTIRPVPGTGQAWLFARLAAATGNSGWIHYYDSPVSSFRAGAANGVGTFVPLTINVFTPTVQRRYAWTIIVSTLANNVLTARMNGMAADATIACVGYTPAVAGTAVRIGNSDTAASPASFFPVADCAMWNTYDGTGFVSATFGNGLAGLIAMWGEDLQQGRYLTKPQGGALGANDYYWAARDIVTGPTTTKASWTDRGTNASLLSRVGSPNSAGYPVRF